MKNKMLILALLISASLHGAETITITVSDADYKSVTNQISKINSIRAHQRQPPLSVSQGVAHFGVKPLLEREEKTKQEAILKAYSAASAAKKAEIEAAAQK